MKKKLTVFEIIGIIVISIIILFVLIIPSIKMFSENRRNANSTKEEMVLLALGNFVKEQRDILPVKQGESITLNIGILKQLNYLDENFIDKETDMCVSNDTPVSITKIGTTFQYKTEWDKGKSSCDEITSGPIIILKGQVVEYVEFGYTYVDKGYITLDNKGNLIDENVEVVVNNSSFVDTYKFNTYLLTYNLVVNDKHASLSRSVIVRDTTPPEITLLENQTVPASLQNIDLRDDIVTKDNSGVPPTIKIEGELSLGTVGMYKIIYTATDHAGNSTTKIRLITVYDDLPPAIDDVTLNNKSNDLGFYTSDIIVAVTISDVGGSGIGGFIYCTTSKDDCVPNLKVSSSNGNIVLKQNSSDNMFCLYAFDNNDNISDTRCFGPYNFMK